MTENLSVVDKKKYPYYIEKPFTGNRVGKYLEAFAAVLKFTDYNAPYKWVWNEQTPFFHYIIKAVVYDVHGFQTSDVIKVYKLHYLVTY